MCLLIFSLARHRSAKKLSRTIEPWFFERFDLSDSWISVEIGRDWYADLVEMVGNSRAARIAIALEITFADRLVVQLLGGVAVVVAEDAA